MLYAGKVTTSVSRDICDFLDLCEGRVSTKTVQCSYICLAHWMPEFSTFFRRTIAAVKTDKYGRTPRIFPTACRPRKTARIEHRTCRRWVTLRLIHPVYCASSSRPVEIWICISGIFCENMTSRILRTIYMECICWKWAKDSHFVGVDLGNFS